MDIGLLTLGDLLPDPATGRKLTPAARHRQIVDLGVRAEEMGFDLFSVGEHHLCDYVLSAPPVVLAAVAARTERIRLSTGVTLIGSLDPLRVAEDYATLDAISNGRVEVVVGRGIVRRTYRDLGYDPEQSQALFTEHVEALLEFWTKDESDWPSRGLQAVTAQPRPEQKPHPPVWIGSASEISVDRAASLGLPLMLPTVIRPLQDFQPVVDRYREKFKPSVRGSQPRVGAVSYAHIAANSDEARRRWMPHQMGYLGWAMNVFVPWGEVNFGPNMFPTKIPTFEDICSFSMCGSADEVIDKTNRACEALDLDVQLAMFDQGGLPQALLDESVQRFAEEVMPHIR